MGSGLRELLKFRDLFLVFIWREFSIRYRQSLIGVLWAIVQPVSMMLLFTFVFSYVMPLKVSDYPYPVFLYAALLPWTFFSSSLNYAIPSLVGHYNLITKIYFPRAIIPLSGVGLALIDFVIASIFFVLLLAVYQIQATVNVLWFFPLLLLLLLFTVSMSLIFSALNVYYRDVNLAINFLVQLWFFATPIFYSTDKVPDKFRIILFLNPLSFIVVNIRRCLVEGNTVIWWQYLIMLAIIVSIAVISYKFFMITERKFADVI